MLKNLTVSFVGWAKSLPDKICVLGPWWHTHRNGANYPSDESRDRGVSDDLRRFGIIVTQNYITIFDAKEKICSFKRPK